MSLITLRNLTGDDLSCADDTSGHVICSGEVGKVAHITTKNPFSWWRKKQIVLYTKAEDARGTGSDVKVSDVQTEPHPQLKFTLPSSKKLRRVVVDHTLSPDVKVNAFSLNNELFVLPQRDMSSWMKGLGDSVGLDEMVVPGTHETMSFSGWPISQCQTATDSAPLLFQLNSGIRVLDVRLGLAKSSPTVAAPDILMTYHGIIAENTPLPSILSTLHAFLQAHPSETIVVSFKQEDSPAEPFNRILAQDIANSEGGWGMWATRENYIPRLGEVRGKCVLFSRFGGTVTGWPVGPNGQRQEWGIHPTTWPDSWQSGFTWTCGDCLVRTSDWYNIPSFLAIPTKFTLATENLQPPSPLPSPFARELNISFFSASSIPFAFPPTIATGVGWPNGWAGWGFEGMNSRLAKWLMPMLGLSDSGTATQTATVKTPPPAKGSVQVKLATPGQPKVTGWVMLDFFNDPANTCVPLLVEMNYQQLAGR